MEEEKFEYKFINLDPSEKKKPLQSIVYFSAGGLPSERLLLPVIIDSIPDGSNVGLKLVKDSTLKNSEKRLEGFIKDIMGALELQQRNLNLQIEIVNDYECTDSDSSIVIKNKGSQKKFGSYPDIYEVDNSYILSEELKKALIGETEEKKEETISEYDSAKISATSSSSTITKNKITYIGGTGKIGRLALNKLVNEWPLDKELEIVLLSSDHEGSSEKLQSIADELKKYGKNITFTITDNYKEMSNSELVICSAGKWPTPEQKAELKKTDPTGRNVQSLVNKDMIYNIATEINKNCPDAKLLLLTNQVDTMCHVARQPMNPNNVVGLTGMVDSTRLKQNLRESNDGKLPEGINPTQLMMIGYHNSDMIPLLPEIDPKILEGTRTMGGYISNLYREGLDPNVDTGASILPATAVAMFVEAFLLGKILTEAFNVKIKDKEIAKQYGVEVGTELSIPVQIGRNSIEQAKLEKELSSEQQEHLRKISEDMLVLQKQICPTLGREDLTKPKESSAVVVHA